MSRKGNFYIVAAPSGAGKTSLVNALIESMADIQLSVSYTTRPPRVGEIDGVHYHFINEKQFQEMLKTRQFLEYAEIYGYYYGTSHQVVLQQLEKGHDVILEIDWQGARQILQKFPQAVSIFIFPPSMDVLRERLTNRQQDSDEVICRRLAAARAEMSHYHEFDYLIINDKFEQALQDLQHIIKAQHLQSSYQEKIWPQLLAELV